LSSVSGSKLVGKKIEMLYFFSVETKIDQTWFNKYIFQFQSPY